MNKIKYICPICKKEFQDYQSNPKRIYCSIKCKNKVKKEAWWIKQNSINPGIKKGEKTRFRKKNIPWWIIKGLPNPSTLDEIKEKKSKSMIGKLAKEKNPNWKGGISKERDKLRFTQEYINWRKSILERDDYTCQICNNKGGYLHAHHILPVRNYKKYITDELNGITLCKKCHYRLNRKEIEYAKKFGWYDIYKREEPKIIDGGKFIDDRGSISFVNDFNFYESDIQRMYYINNLNKDTIRAFHSHIYEGKYVYVLYGSFKIIISPLIKLNDKYALDKENIKEYILSDEQPKILYIPPGYTNGFKALSDNNGIIFFSTSTLEESNGDDIRFDYKYFGEDIWKNKHR